MARSCCPLSLSLLTLALFTPLAATGADDAVEVLTVMGERRLETPINTIPGELTIIDEEALQQQLAISNNVEKALINLVPGYNNNTFPTLRGRRALVLINGTPQNETLRESSGFDIENIDPQAIERIEVTRGATALYGYGAPGGVINIVTRRARSEGTEQQVSVGTGANSENVSDSLTYRGRYQVLHKKGDVDVALGLGYDRDKLPYDANGEMIPDYSWDTDDGNVDGTLGWQISPDMELVARANVQKRWINKSYSGGAGNYPEQAAPAVHDAFADGGYVLDQQYSLSFSHDRIFAHTRFKAEAYVQDHYDTEIQDLGDGLLVDDQLNNDSLGARTTFTTELDPWWQQARIHYGLDFMRDRFDRPAINTATGAIQLYFAPPVELNTYALFVQAELPLGERWLLNTGWRHEEYRGEVEETSAYRGGITGGDVEDDRLDLFNLGLVYLLTDDDELYAGIAQGTNITQLGRAARTASRHDQIKLEADPSTQYELGYRGRTASSDYSLVAFYSRSDKGVTLVPDPEDPINNPLMVRREPRQVWGVEATLNYSLTERHDLGSTFTWQEGIVDPENNDDWTRMDSGEISPARITAFWTWSPAEAWQSHLQGRYGFVRTAFENNPLGDFNRGNVDQTFIIDYSLSWTNGAHRLTGAVDNLFNADDWDQGTQSYNDPYYATRIEGRTISLGYDYRW